MNKEELLKELSNKITTGEISYDEMMSRFGLNAVVKEVPAQASVKVASNFSITKMLYALGAIIVVIGIILFTYQIWDSLGSMGRIVVTLGLGLLVTASGSFILKSKKEDKLGMVFHFIGGMLIPGGALVMLSEFSSGQPPEWPLAITFGIIFAFYLFINSIHKSVILTFFAIANGTTFIYLIVNAITSGIFTDYTNLFTYLTMIIGACYILLALSFKNTWNDRLTRFLYLFGFVGIQIAAITQYFNSFGYRNSAWPAVFSFLLIFVFYLFINSKIKNPALTFLTILNGTAFMYVTANALIGPLYNSDVNIYTYLTIVIGGVYLLLSSSFRNTWNARLTEILNLLGIVALLGAAFSEIFGSLPWQFFFLILVIGGFALSIYVRSLSILLVSTIAFLSYVSYITSEYFADSIGWPISLVVLGFIFIALGYVSITINKKYIRN
jgi:peptidoglycan/LPS O-acetylase OafA/YrhL